MFDAGHARRSEAAVLVQRDWRADGGSRSVSVTRRGVLIARRLGGIDMRISVPIPAYLGVLLAISEGEDGAPRYRLSLAHPDRDLDVILAEMQDSAAAAADWKFWSAWLGLPRLTAENGDFADVDGARRPVAALTRRGASAVRRRRPRFLAGRKAGDPVRMDDVFAGEREIICYE